MNSVRSRLNAGDQVVDQEFQGDAIPASCLESPLERIRKLLAEVRPRPYEAWVSDELIAERRIEAARD